MTIKTMKMSVLFSRSTKSSQLKCKLLLHNTLFYKQNCSRMLLFLIVWTLIISLIINSVVLSTGSSLAAVSGSSSSPRLCSFSEDFEPCIRSLPTGTVDRVTQHYHQFDPDHLLVSLCSQLDSTADCLVGISSQCNHSLVATTIFQFTLLRRLQQHLKSSVCSTRESRFRFRRRLLCYTSPGMGRLLLREWPKLMALAALVRSEAEADLQKTATCAAVWYGIARLRHHLIGTCGPREGLVDLDALYSRTLWLIVSMACGPFRSFEELMSHLPADLRERIERTLAGDSNANATAATT